MKYKVVQWATGGIGKAAIQGIVRHPELELVGCWVHSREKAGIDAGVLAGISPIGVSATSDVRSILDTSADCVVYSPAYPRERDVIQLLESGKSVVTPTGWFYPHKRLDTTALEAACRRGHSVLHGTGIHPGGFTERFPLQLASLQSSTRHVRSEEFSDIRTYGAPEIVGNMMGFGKSPDETKATRVADFLAIGFYQSIQMVADGLMMDIDELRTLHDISIATVPIPSPVGTIAPGKVAAQRFVWQGLHNGEPVIEAIVNWFMGEEGFDQPWRFGAEGPRYEIEVRGDPTLKAVYHGMHPTSLEAGLVRNEGIVATAMQCVNSIPYVCRAEPGIRTYLDLPLIAGRADPALFARAAN